MATFIGRSLLLFNFISHAPSIPLYKQLHCCTAHTHNTRALTMNGYQYYCIVVIVVTIAVCSADRNAIDDQFAEFKLKYGKQYSDSGEEIRRKSLFIQAKEYIDKHNSNPKRTYSLKINKFSDMDSTEFSQTRKGYRSSPLSMKHGLKDHVKTYKPTTTVDVLPSMVDWREKGVVTEVKDQGQCGSCWAFSTTGTLEGQHAIATGELVSLSEQQLLDCSTLNNGCDGGKVDSALSDIEEIGGIATDDEYPYLSFVEYKCRFNESTVAATCTGYKRIESMNCDDLKVAVATVGPISVAMDASETSFMSYSDGVYQPDEECSTTRLDHALLAVGYGTEDGVDYWLIKNSWGVSWGMDGYFKIAAADNTCGICTYAVYPLV